MDKTTYLEDSPFLKVSQRDFDMIVESIKNPPKPTPYLIEVLRKSKIQDEKMKVRLETERIEAQRKQAHTPPEKTCMLCAYFGLYTTEAE